MAAMIFSSMLLALCLTASFSVVRSQTLADKLFLQFLPPNGAAIALTPPAILRAETPIVVRYTLIGAIAIYEPQAACQPQALSFFGTRDKIPSALCNERDNSILRSYTVYRALLKEFPTEMEGYRNFLATLGLEPKSSSRDVSTLNGWANVYGDRIANFFADDGWNSLGDVNARTFRAPFQDYTGYQPENCPSDFPSRLRRPLRWQPLTNQADGRGLFAAQVHVVPQIASLHPLVLTSSEVRKRRQNSPYKKPNKGGSIASSDFKLLRKLTRELILISGQLSAQQRFLAQWWNNKLFSTAAISAYYERAAGLSRYQIAQQFMGEMMSQYDALIVTWKEKVRHDLARPRTILPNIRRGEKFRAFISDERGFETVSAEEWQPYILEQPHSEFPSGSAALCMAAMEHIEAYVETKLAAENKKVPAIKIQFPVEVFEYVRQDEAVSFPGPAAAARSCAESRLWAGVHFRPAITAGAALGKGIGKLVFEHITQLGNGEVPSNCDRCKKMGSR